MGSFFWRADFRHAADSRLILASPASVKIACFSLNRYCVSPLIFRMATIVRSPVSFVDGICKDLLTIISDAGGGRVSGTNYLLHRPGNPVPGLESISVLRDFTSNSKTSGDRRP